MKTMDRRQFAEIAAAGGSAAVASAMLHCTSRPANTAGHDVNTGASSEAGLSPARFGHLHEVMRRHVERGDLPGLVTLVSRRGEVQVDAIGTTAVDGRDPMRRDTIFRISSMTKPITAAATMLLVEEGKIGLDESIDRMIPELANRKVLRRIDGPLDDTAPAKRPITVRDLLTFRMGFGQVWAPPNAYPILKAEHDLELMTLGPPAPPTPHPPDEWIRRFATLPLMHQPGEKWMYNTSAHVLGVLVARASGEPLETLFRKRIFEPLGMKDTAFSVPAPKLERLASEYRRDRASGKLVLFDGVENSQWSRPPRFADAAAGLVSTADDFAAFGRMLLDKGSFGGERLLSAASVESMTSNQLTPEQKGGPDAFLGERGWGFGMAVTTQSDALSTVPGRYGWDGGFGTSWASDPKRDLMGILLTQRLWESPKPPDVSRDFWTSVYQGVDAPSR